LAQGRALFRALIYFSLQLPRQILMSVAVDSTEFFSTSVVNKLAASFGPRCKLDSMSGSSKGVTPYIFGLYFLFAMKWAVMLEHVSEGDFSMVLTGAATVQFLGFSILVLKVCVTGPRSLDDLSSQSLLMFAVYLCFRLSSTCVMNGYIPVDPSGDWFYQLMDICSLGCIIYLLYCMHLNPRYVYDSDKDNMSISPLLLPCILYGVFVHGNFNRHAMYDTIWQISTNIETLALLPQLMLLSKTGGKVDASTCHWIVCTVASCLCRFQFWVYAWEELHLECPAAAWNIFLLHIVQLLLCADFMFYYAKAWVNGKEMILPSGAM